MLVALGVLLHALGGFASGSFYLPYKKVRGWAWESYWLVGGLVSWLVAPWVLGGLTVPHLLQVLRQADAATLGWTYSGVCSGAWAGSRLAFLCAT